MVAAALAVLALFSGTGASTVLAAWMAASAGQHTVSISADDEQFSLVLSHDNTTPTRALLHRHCLASKAALLLGSKGTQPDGDHILRFDRLGHAAGSATRVSFDKGAALAPSIALSPLESLVFDSARRVPWREGFKEWQWRSAQPFGRSTVLLI